MWWGSSDEPHQLSFFYIFQTVINSQLKRKLKRINLVKLIIFYHLCSYLCTLIYNQKGIFYVQIRITPSFKKDNS